MNKSVKKIFIALVYFFVLVSSGIAQEELLNSEDEKSGQDIFVNMAIEPELFGIPIGSTVDILEDKFIRLYQHTLPNGEILHESCNQELLEVFTFVEESWSLGYISYMAVRKVDDINICRDADGELPDYGIMPETPRGIGLGDSREKIIEQYGLADEENELPDHSVILAYVDTYKESSVENMILHFRLVDNIVVAFSLAADLPGAKKPWDTHENIQ
ncbi:MAG: hypothetical protein H6755_00625 [Candidatus Omnitrophica bacterium]|nr:hypothetical protein [Candidatus Omnitrophota bacterium]MCB9746892.1 hypothetical protein [Candidatus Omnitrophota bacterium]